MTTKVSLKLTCTDDEISVSGEMGKLTIIVVGLATPHVAVGLGYESVGGCDKAIQLMRELLVKLVPLCFPELWSTAGVPTQKGVLLHGPPGCGKTLIANALVEETVAHVVVVNGPEIMARKGGESEANLCQAFEEAIEKTRTVDSLSALECKRPMHMEVVALAEAPTLAIT